MRQNETMIAKGFTQPTQRVERLKKAIYDAVPVLEVERAVLLTKAYQEAEGLSPIMRRAKAMEMLLDHMHVTIRDDELIVGSPTAHPRSSEIGIEYSIDWLLEQMDDLSTRAQDPYYVSDESKEIIRAIAPFWKGKTNSDYALSLMSPQAMEGLEHGVYDSGSYIYSGVGHSVVNYERIVKDGFEGVIRDCQAQLAKLDRSRPEDIQKEQFYQALIRTYQAAIRFAHRYAKKAEELAAKESDPQRRAELLRIAENCAHGPQYGARNFYEAVQTFWLVHCIIRIESNGYSYSPGPFDRYMYPFYQNDTSITEDFAQEVLDCLFVKFNDSATCRDSVTAQAQAGYGMFEMVALGGMDTQGHDLTNDLTYLCLNAAAHVRMPMPSVGVRISNQTPEELLLRVCEVVRLGFGQPAIFNDEVIIQALMNRGMPLEVARIYTPSGCVEPDIAHHMDAWHSPCFFNLAKVMELTMNNGRDRGAQVGPVTGEITTFTCIEDFMEAYRRQLSYFVRQMVDNLNCLDIAFAQKVPLSFQSALIEDCIAQGKSVQEGGAEYNLTSPQGIAAADAGDCLYAIEKNVFQDKKITLAQLKDALDHNFGLPIPPGTGVSIEQPTQPRSCLEAAAAQAAAQPAPAPAAGDAQPLATTLATTLGKLDSDSRAQLEKLVQHAAGSGGVLPRWGQHCPPDLLRALLQGSAPTQSAAPTAAAAPPQATAGTDYAAIQRLLDNTPGYYGNDNDAADRFVAFVARTYCEEVAKYRNARGGPFQAALFPVASNVIYGYDVGALPDGRTAKRPLADGVSPRAGKDTHGPTAAANSVSKLDHALASNGTLYNVKFLPSALAGDKGLLNLAALIRSYFDRKGMEIQFNVVDRATLLDAQAHPAQYQDLVVRVAGYSANFTKLAKDVQDALIARTEQSF